MNHHGSLNRVYRLIYSRVQNAWVAVSEVTKGQGKGKSRTRLMLILPVLLPVLAQASPTGGMVTSGTGKISQVGNTTTISQGSQSLNLSWTGFNIAPNETVNFNQPNASSVVVNRISDANGAQIEGHLNANGQVYLIDPNGILFGKGAQVNVGGLVAATMDFASQGGVLSFSGNGGKAKIDNQGVLTAARGGFIALLGHVVRNEGTVTAQLGTVTLGGGSAFTLTFAGNDRVGVVVTRSQLNDLASNGGILQANGGNIVMTAGARDALLASSVNNSGIIEAQTVQGQAGHIQLLSGMGAGTTTNNGTLDASAPNGGNGGFIETSGHGVNMGNNATITTQATSGLNGSWLIDPNDFTIAATGGDITGAALGTALGLNSVTIQTTGTTPTCTGVICGTGTTGGTGNINVNDTVSWSSANTLTLNAWNNINFNSALNVTGTGTLALLYGQSAANAGNAGVYNVNAPINLASTAHFTTKLGNDTTGAAATPINYTVIDSLGVSGDATTAPVTPSLQGMAAPALGGLVGGNYVLGANIDATATGSWNGGAGFTPIGPNSSQPFTGILDGLGHTISNLTINQHAGSFGAGLFGAIGSPNSNTVIQHLGLIQVSVGGDQYVGGLAGTSTDALIRNVYVSGGTVKGNSYVGGLVGYEYGNSSANVNAPLPVVTHDFTNVAVSGLSSTSFSVGGLVGGFRGSAGLQIVNPANYGKIDTSFSIGSVSGGSNVGGLVGSIYLTSISNSFASGSVKGVGNVGGLIGQVSVDFPSTNTIQNVYATGIVSSYGTSQPTQGFGGLIGNNGGMSVTNAYAAGQVSGPAGITGGLTGPNPNLPLVPDNHNSYWNTTTTGQSTTADGGTGLTTSQMQQQINFTGWDFANTWISYPGYTYPLLRTFMSNLTVTANSVTKTYNGLSFSGGSGVTLSQLQPVGFFPMDTVTLGTTTSPVLTGSLVGPGITPESPGFTGNSQGAVNASATPYTLGVSGLYSDQLGFILNVLPGQLTVNPAALTITANNATKTYGQTATLAGTAFTESGLQNGETIGSVTESSGGTVATAGVLGSPYAIVASNASGGTFNAANYSVGYVSGQLTVNPAALTITANNATKTYGQTVTLAGTAFTESGLQNGETIGSVTESSGGTVATAGVLGSPYAIVASNASGGTFNAANYSVGYVSGQLTVNPAALTITANNATKTYGQTATLAGTAFTESGLQNGETIGSVTESSGGTVATAGVLGSPYAIVASNASGGTFNAANYSVGYVSGQLTVNPAALTITANNATKTYGQTATLAGTAFTESGLQNGETIGSVTESSGGTVATAGVLGSPYAIVASNASGGTFNAANYSVGYVSGQLTVNPAALTITANNATKTYGQTATLAGTAFTESGLQNGETIGSVTESSGGTVATAGVLGSPYAIVASNASGGTFNAANYRIRYVNGQLIVTPLSVINFESLELQTVIAFAHWPTRYSGAITNGWLVYDYQDQTGGKLVVDSPSDRQSNLASERPISVYERENRMNWKIGDKVLVDVVLNDPQVQLAPAKVKRVLPTEPPVPQSYPIATDKVSMSADVLFDFDKSVIKKEGKEAIQEVLKGTVFEHGVEKVLSIDIVGNTDWVGSNAYNDALSLRRANAVRNYLIELGIPGSVIHATGHGKRDPIDSNDSAEGRAANRRDDITIVRKAD